METCPDLEGWTDSEYKEFDRDDENIFESDEDDDQEDGVVRGYSSDKYKKILFIEELLPE
ncbi:hypothetical protein OAA41_00280 [bacterium]|nr:hypothetical protein [bacterium]